MIHSQNCPHPQLTELFRGRLPYAEVEPLARHLETCLICARAAEQSCVEDPLAESLRGQDSPIDGPERPEIDRLIEALCRLGRDSSDRTAQEGAVRIRPVLAGLYPAADTAWDADEALSPPCGPGELGQLGGYRVISRLGAGSMGVVYLARQARPDRTVALKVVATGSRLGGERSARFRAETEVVAQLSHSNIITVFEAGESEGVLFLAMEFAAGGSLAALLSRHSLPPREAAALIIALARGVAYAHARGVVHRDLKPSNVLLAVDGAPKVGDFGIAKCLDLSPGMPVGIETQTGAILGTPGYMAPEQAIAQAVVGPAADIYGLGAILYECLTGRPPFKAATVLETLDQLRTRDPVPIRSLQPGLSRDLENVCLKCLEKDPARRYPTAEALADDLGRFLRGEPVTARPASPARRACKWARRRPTVAALVAACVLGAVALATITGVYTSQLQDAVGQANANAAEADRQRKLSAANYKSARSALRRMLAQLDDRRVEDTPRLNELRQRQREEALAFYQEMLAGLDNPSPEIKLDVALAGVEAGSTQYVLGRPAAAKESFLRAIALIEELPAEYHTQSDCRYGLIQSYQYLANLTSDQPDVWQRYFLKAREEAEELVRSDPTDARRQNALARVEHTLAAFYQAQGQNNRAEEPYLRAVAIRTGLIERHPDVDLYRADLAEDLLNLGLLYSATHRPTQAADAFRKAEGWLLPLAEARTADERYGLSLAGAYVNWGNLLRGTDLTAALVKFDQAVKLADAAVAREPRYVVARQRALQAHGSRAIALDQGKRYAEAVADYDRVVEYSEGPARLHYRSERVQLLTQAGMYALAASEALDLARQSGLPDYDHYNLACALARSVEPAVADSPLGALVGVAEGESRAVAAIGLLRRLHATGYFRKPNNTKLLTDDPDLNSLRSRPDFRELLTDVPVKPKP